MVSLDRSGGLGDLASPSPLDARRRDAAIGDLYRKHWVGLVRLAVLMVDDVQSAEDAVQEAFAEVHRQWHRIRDLDKALGYLRTAVLNQCRSVLRRRRVARRYTPPAETPVASPELTAVEREEHAAVHRALIALPVRTREVLVLRYYLDLPFAEIASTLGISSSTARATASRGITTLGEKLKDI